MILLGADFPSSQRTHFTIPLLGASEHLLLLLLPHLASGLSQ